VKLAISLIDILKQNQKINEKKSNYSNRILKEALKIMGV